MIETSSIPKLVSLLQAANARRISIDGVDGVGKSTLASDLARHLNLKIFHLDDFLAKHRDSYLNNLDIKKLSSELTNEEDYIIEGVCLIKALTAASISPEIRIYMKRVSCGTWADEDRLTTKIPVDERLQELKNQVQQFATLLGETGELGIAEEVIRYHIAFCPHEHANVTYLRTDNAKHP